MKLVVIIQNYLFSGVHCSLSKIKIEKTCLGHDHCVLIFI